MKTDAVKWCMQNGGLNTNRLIAFSSDHQPSNDEGKMEPVTETFMVHAPDGSQFVVQITKVLDERKD